MTMTWGPATLVAMLMVFASAHGATAAPPSYDDYRAVLMAFVDDDGLVDYASLKAQRGDLDDFVSSLGAVQPVDYQSWSDADKIAFWINAYNALTLHVIITHPAGGGMVSSIRDIPGVWDRMRFAVMGTSVTLDEIEKERLRAFKEPRIHMALVCAAMSCPRLRREPYEGAKLEQQLDDQVRDFMTNPRHVRFDTEHKIVYVSEIFRWYAHDFVGGVMTWDKTPAQHAVFQYVGKYLGKPARTFLNEARIEYIPYDWSLNDQRR